MNILRRALFWGGIILVGFAATGNLLCTAVESDGANTFSSSGLVLAGNADTELDRFFKAKEHVFKRSWEKARRGFESYLKDYPQGRLRDEGLYWLASSLNMLSKKEKGSEIIALKAAAIEKLDELIERHPKSLWRDDGTALRVEIASVLILMGESDYTPVLNEAIQSQNKDARQLRILALNSLGGLDESYARPLIEKILETDPDTEIRKNCLKLLARNYSESSLELLQTVAAGDADKGVREAADLWVKRITKSRIPVYLKYDIYGSRLLDDSLYTKFPEGQIQTLVLSTRGPLNSRAALNLVNPVFDGQISAMSSSANGVLPFPGVFLSEHMIKTSNRAGDYMLWFKPDELNITEDTIDGVVEFMHRQTKQKTDVPFHVNKGEVKLLTTRSGNLVSILVIQFDSEKKSSVTLKADQVNLPEDWGELMKMAGAIGTEAKSPYSIMFSDMMGWSVNTARENWTIDDLIGKSGRVDFGQAEAVSIDPKGWTLVGQLVLMKEKKLWLGRQAVLTDPSGKTVAKGEQIFVPADNPEKYKTTSPDIPVSLEEDSPDYGPFQGKASFQIKQGIKVQTDREYFDADEFTKNLVLFGRSRASLPEKNTKVAPPFAQNWTLLGDIFWIRDKNQLIGAGALLVDPERQVKAQGLISIPLDDPASFLLLQGESWSKGRVLVQADERNTRTYYSAEINGIQGWQVMTTLQSGPSQAGGGVDYSLSQATRMYESEEYVLVGHITHYPEKSIFLARRAALICSNGDIVYGAEIEVPTGNPARAKVTLKSP